MTQQNNEAKYGEMLVPDLRDKIRYLLHHRQFDESDNIELRMRWGAKKIPCGSRLYVNQIACYIGVVDSVFSKLSSGKRKIKHNQLAEIAEAFLLDKKGFSSSLFLEPLEEFKKLIEESGWGSAGRKNAGDIGQNACKWLFDAAKVDGNFDLIIKDRDRVRLYPPGAEEPDPIVEVNINERVIISIGLEQPKAAVIIARVPTRAVYCLSPSPTSPETMLHPLNGKAIVPRTSHFWTGKDTGPGFMFAILTDKPLGLQIPKPISEKFLPEMTAGHLSALKSLVAERDTGRTEIRRLNYFVR